MTSTSHASPATTPDTRLTINTSGSGSPLIAPSSVAPSSNSAPITGTPLPPATIARLASIIGSIPGCTILPGSGTLHDESTSRNPIPHVRIALTGWSPSLHQIDVHLNVPITIPESFVEARQRLWAVAVTTGNNLHVRAADPSTITDDPRIRRGVDDLSDTIAEAMKSRLARQRRRAERAISIGIAQPMECAINWDVHDSYSNAVPVALKHVDHLMIDRLLAVAAIQRRSKDKPPIGVSLADAVHNLHRDCGAYYGGPSISDRRNPWYPAFLKEEHDHATLSYAIPISDKMTPDGNYADIVDGATLSLTGKHIPEAVAASAAGRRLRDLIDTSTIPGSPDRIIERVLFRDLDTHSALQINLVPDPVPIGCIGTLKGDNAIAAILSYEAKTS